MSVCAGAYRPRARAQGTTSGVSRLDLVGVNDSRAIGPALAGLVIAHLGSVPVVFALNAVSVVPIAIAVLFWRRSGAELGSGGEHFMPAIRAGGRYVWHEPVVIHDGHGRSHRTLARPRPGRMAALRVPRRAWGLLAVLPLGARRVPWRERWYSISNPSWRG
jgi:hypothetical protein